VIKNFGINTGGTFNGLAGTVTFDPSNLASASFNVSVEAKTVDTDMEGRDNHLRKAGIFRCRKISKDQFQIHKDHYNK
jgi:polyisoprenoid-binding protein YceI